MNRLKKIERLNAKYIALRYAYSWISEPAEQHYDSDFYSEIEENYLLDKSKLNDTTGARGDERKCFSPSSEDIKIIKAEFLRLTRRIIKELQKTRDEFEMLNSEQNLEECDARKAKWTSER